VACPGTRAASPAGARTQHNSCIPQPMVDEAICIAETLAEAVVVPAEDSLNTELVYLEAKLHELHLCAGCDQDHCASIVTIPRASRAGRWSRRSQGGCPFA
jgi:hypothetical protein